MCFGKPDVEGREADFEPETDDGAGERREHAAGLKEKNAREHERARARVTREEVDPGRLADLLFGVLKRDESGRGKPHRFPGEQEREHSRCEHDADHCGDCGEIEQPESRKVATGLAVEIGGCVQRSRESNEYDGQKKDDFERIHERMSLLCEKIGAYFTLFGRIWQMRPDFAQQTAKSALRVRGFMI